MEFNAEFIEKNQLTDDQIGAINKEVNNYLDGEFKTELGNKVHENTEKNLEKIWGTVKDLTGIDRNRGEKFADSIQRVTGLHFKTKEENYNLKLKELEDKLKNTKGDEALKKELHETKEQINELKRKEAEYDEWVKNDYKGKAESYSDKLSKMEQRIAFKDNLPNKPENVNKYEWDAKIKQFQLEILEKNNLVFDENETAWLVDKENEFKKTKLSEVIKQNTDIQELIKGREQRGLGSNGKKSIEIEGVPFKVPEEATPQERQQAIKEYLAGRNINTWDSEYPKKYSELNSKILGLEKKQA